MATTNNNDKRFYQLTLAIQKAINSIETPVKEKHVRSTIIGTFQEQSAITYWMVAIRLPLQDNRIVAWKFCHVTHKLLREGHPACLDDSQRHINMIENLGKLWVHLREGYGRLVHLYCALLVCKLKFHARNPRFPGNLQLTADELDAIAENDVNNYFQICVELFDYMDDILTLQAAVFDSLGNARANSMTASGQCRLAALIPCAQDSSQIYDCNVRLLFRLHAALPADTLSGHRERFRQQFKKLSSFYKHASSLQYYRNLLTLPVLPSNPPNFLLQSDFGTYVTPVVSIPEQPPDEVDAVGSLIDTSDTISQATTPDHLDAFEARTTPSPQPDPVVERDRLIEHLQNELKRMRTEMVEERNTIVTTAREQYTRLGMELREAKTALEEERQRSRVLLEQTPEIKQKLSETEEKARVTDEKFQKLKGAYTQLREEHITLIRQKAEVDKLSAGLRAAAAQHESAKVALQQQLNDRMKDVELLQQSASTSEEVEAYKSELTNLRTELEQSRQKEVELETLRASIEALEIENKTAKAEQEVKLTALTNELKETTEALEKIKQEKDERENELSKTKEELVGLREKSTDQYKVVVEEKEAAEKRVAELIQQHQQEKEEQIVCINKMQVELENLQQKLTVSEIDFAHQSQQLKDEIDAKNKEIENIVNTKDIEVEQALGKITILQNDLETRKNNYDLKVEEQSAEIARLTNELTIYKQDSDSMTKALAAEKENIEIKLNEASQKIEHLEKEITEKADVLSKLEISLTETQTKNEFSLQELENIKNNEISKLKDELAFTLEKKVEFESKVNTMGEEMNDLQSKLNNYIQTIEVQKTEFDAKYKEKEIEVTVLNDKLQNIVECKDEIIENLKSMIAEKDKQVIDLNVEVTKLSETVQRLEEELKETQAELEIGRNEFITLKEEHDDIVLKNESNLALKNKEFRDLTNENSKISTELQELITEKANLMQQIREEKQDFELTKKGMEEEVKTLQDKCEAVINEKETLVNSLNSDIENIKLEYEQFKIEKENEIKTLNEKVLEQDAVLTQQIREKDDSIDKSESENKILKEELEELRSQKLKEKEEMDLIISEKEKEKQMLEAKIERVEGQRLNAECELQDLLQHNNILEVDVASLKKQLEEAKKELEKQSTRIVLCAGDAALEVTSEALTALDACNAQESNRAAAELAAKALEDLARYNEVKGNEESLARSAMLAAHNAAQLSVYATEVSNLSTDISLADKLTSDCRTMLTATKQWIESLKSGSPSSASYEEARELVLSVAAAAAAAGRPAGALSVDDELAGMDQAIEEAASQIEEMLAASRAGDSGVKLEVNGKILDACTTLMAAVKLLVQDARALQTELGDPKTRLKMYRNNPQWSEGLISAAKAVVFAAKLLVSSADEAVGAAGRLEGVSAAAHEVAGSTAQLVAASRARAPPASAPLARLTRASRSVAAATGAVVAAVRAGSALRHDTEALDTSALTLTATRRLEMESKVRALELESALDAERARLAALRKRHYHLAQADENGGITNGKE